MKKEDRYQFIVALRFCIITSAVPRLAYYCDLMSLSGIFTTELGDHLGLVAEYCKWKGWPALNALIVSKETLMPSDNYWVNLHPNGDLLKCWIDCWKKGKDLNEKNYLGIPDIDIFWENQIKIGRII